MKPDDEMLGLWVEDELEGPERERIEAWAAGEPEWLEMREQARASRGLLGSVLSAREEVPHGEFFDARVRREIRREAAVSRPAAKVSPRRSLPWSFLAPLTAVAGIVFGFWIGRGGAGGEVAPMTDAGPVLYTPDRSVKAEWVESSEDATVIVLAGVEALPDRWEIPESARTETDSDRRAVKLDP